MNFPLHHIQCFIASIAMLLRVAVGIQGNHIDSFPSIELLLSNCYELGSGFCSIECMLWVVSFTNKTFRFHRIQLHLVVWVSLSLSVFSAASSPLNSFGSQFDSFSLVQCFQCVFIALRSFNIFSHLFASLIPAAIYLVSYISYHFILSIYIINILFEF